MARGALRGARNALLPPRSVCQLKPLKAIELILDTALELLACLALRRLAGADPAPLLHEQLPVLAVGLEVKCGYDLIVDQNRKREMAETALGLGHIGLELVAVAEDELAALALDDEGIEGRKNMDERRCRALAFALQRLRPRPMLLLAGALDCDRHQLLLAHPRLDDAAHRGLARRVEVTDRIQAHH